MGGGILQHIQNLNDKLVMLKAELDDAPAEYFKVAKYRFARPELLINNAIIAANNNTRPLAASNLKNHLNGLDI